MVGTLSTLTLTENPVNQMKTYTTRMYTTFGNAKIYIPQYVLQGLTLNQVNKQKVAIIGHISTNLANQDRIVVDEIAIFRESNPDNI